MPQLKFNHRKRPGDGAAATARKALWRRVAAVAGVVAIAAAGIGATVMTAGADPHPVEKDVIADESTLANWSGAVGIEDTTENVGRIWTDKTVQTGDVTLSGDVDQSTTISKGSSDFLVGLSALSSMSNTMTTSTTPLDIVLVLDMSGSMADPIDYTEVYDLQTGNNRPSYYVLVNGEYVELQREYIGGIFGIGGEYQWGYYNNRGRWQEVTPKTSADSRGTQVYAAVSKADALKSAVNEFIDQTNMANATMPADSKHEISIVKFAGVSTDDIGDDTYRDGDYTYNYSQVVTDFISDASSLKTIVNDLDPAGATSADYGFAQAQRVLEGETNYWGQTTLKGDRDNAQQVVIFFTDGEPNHQSGFDGSVANDAIAAAQQIKNDDVSIYSIGVFEDADPSVTNDHSFNCYMHAISSNYPEAEGYIGQRYQEEGRPGRPGQWVDANMGDRAPNSDYYKAATSSEELNSIFDQIGEEVNDGSGAPTQTEGAETETTSGYITTTDQLGAYMKFDGMKNVVFAGTQFTQQGDPTVEDDRDSDYYGWTRYNYAGKVNSDIYGDADLSQLHVYAKEGANLAEGDTVAVRIPASLIPTRYFDVDATNKTMSVTNACPIRIFYGASLKGGVADSVAAGAPMGGLTQDEYTALAAYVQSNQYTDNRYRLRALLLECVDGRRRR